MQLTRQHAAMVGGKGSRKNSVATAVVTKSCLQACVLNKVHSDYTVDTLFESNDYTYTRGRSIIIDPVLYYVGHLDRL